MNQETGSRLEKNGVSNRKTNVTRTRSGALWTVRELKQLGEVPDSVLARRWRRPYYVCQNSLEMSPS
jgi:hypothetical protein